MKRNILRTIAIIMAVVMLGNTNIIYASEQTEQSMETLSDAVQILDEINEKADSDNTELEEISEDEEGTSDSYIDSGEVVNKETAPDQNETIIEGSDLLENEDQDNNVSAEIIEEESVSEYASFFAGCEADAAEYVLSATALADKAKMSKYSNQFESSVEGRDYVPNVIMVAADTEEEAEEVAALYSGRVVQFLEFCAVIELNADPKKEHATVSQAVQASMAMSTPLPAAWPDYYRYSQSTPNDPYLNQNNSNGYQWHHSIIGSQYAWANGYTGKGIKVTVIDTGLGPSSGTHEDLSGATGYDKSSGEDVTYDQSPVGHGTHVAGLVGAKLNSYGGAGVAPECTLYSINADNGKENGEPVGVDCYVSSDIIDAMNFARSNLVTDIINISIGGPAYQPFEERAVNNCYDKGIAVFVAAGNTDTDTPLYPGVYKGAICIAAMDKGNQKAEFSSYGKAVKFTFPGVNIYSTLNNSSNAYGTMDGTSMATPIAAGTAAVILQWAKATGKFVDTNSSKDVDTLIALMKKGAVSVSGTGLGAGYVNIPKAMGLSTNLSKPNKVTFEYANNTIFNSTAENITVYGEAGTTIYYSLDGKTPTYKNGVAANYTGTIDLSSTTSGTINAVGNAKQISIKAIAVNNITRTVGALASVTYKFQPPVSSISISSASGNFKVVKGGKLQLKASISPVFAKNTAVSWEVISKPEGITVSSSGQVSVSSKATVDSFQIRAISKDSASKSRTVTIDVVNLAVIKTIKPAKTSYNITKGETIDIPVTVTKSDGSTGSANSGITWSVLSGDGVTNIVSSNEGIAITGTAIPDKTVVQGIANDGSSATTKITITNKATVPVESITIAGDEYLAPGKSNTYKATITNAKATNKKIIWSVNCIDGSVTINNSGKLTANASAKPTAYTVTATAADGSGKYASKSVYITSAKISSLAIDTTSMDLFRATNRYNAPAEKTFYITVTGGSSEAVEVTSSNPDMLRVTKNGNEVTVSSQNNGTGKVTVTVRTTDGTNLKKTCTVNIVNPPSALTLSAPSGRCNTVAYKKNMTLVATFEQAYGTISASSKKLVWESDNPSAITVDQKGKVTAQDYIGTYATITARTTDGSNLVAKFDVYNCDTIVAIVPGYKLEWGGYTAWRGSTDFTYESWFQIATTHDYNYYASIDNGIACNPFSYTSGSPNVNIYSGKYINVPNVKFNKKGAYTIKVKSKTGDNKSCTIKWVVPY